MAFSSSTFKERKIRLYSIFLSWDKLFLVRETTYVIFDIDIESVMDVPSGTFIHKTRNIFIEKTFKRDKLTNNHKVRENSPAPFPQKAFFPSRTIQMIRKILTYSRLNENE